MQLNRDALCTSSRFKAHGYYFVDLEEEGNLFGVGVGRKFTYAGASNGSKIRLCLHARCGCLFWCLLNIQCFDLA